MKTLSVFAFSTLAMLLIVTPILVSAQAAPTQNAGTGTWKMSGKWTDGFGFQWKLPCKHASCGTGASYTIKGYVDISKVHPGGPRYSVSGSGGGNSFTMTASQNSDPNYCASFTYYGTMTSKTSASGTWTNACGASGSFSMTKGWTAIVVSTSGKNPTST